MKKRNRIMNIKNFLEILKKLKLKQKSTKKIFKNYKIK